MLFDKTKKASAVPNSAAGTATKKSEQKLRAKKLKQQNRKSAKSNAKFAKKVVRQRAPKNAAECIGFQKMYEDGLCEIEPGLYSLSIQFGDINYQLSREEDQINTFTRYCELLNAVSPDVHMQLSLVTQHLDEDAFKAQVFLQKSDQECMEAYRREINQIILDQAMKGQNGLVRNKYITLTVHAESPEEAHRLLANVETNIRAKLKGIKSQSETLTGIQRLQVMHDILLPDVRMDFDYRWLLAEKGLLAKDFITPSSMDFRPQHDDTAASYNDRYRFGHKIGKILYLRDIAPDMTDDFLARLSKLDFNMVIALHVDAVDQHDAIELVKTKMAYMNQEASNGMVKASRQGLPPEMGVRFELSHQITEATELLDKLQNRNQKLFKVSLLVQTYANTEDQLDDQIKRIWATAQEKTCRFDTLEFQQRDAMNSILPIGKKCVGLERTLTTANTAIFMPFTTQELLQPGGCYEGINAHSKNLIVCNRKSLAVANGFIAGMTGAGKSMTTKQQITEIRINWPDDDIIVIDPDGEYSRVAKAFGGEMFEVSAGSGNYLNPMDINENYNDGKDPLIVKSQFLMSFCDLISDNGITAGERTLIDKAAKATYSDYFSHPNKEKMPTLLDFRRNLEKQGAPAAQLVQNLGIYVDGTLDIFAHQSTIDTENAFVVYSLKGIGKQLMTPGMMVVLDQISNRMTRNRAMGKRTWIFIDEIQLLFLNDYCSEYFFSWSGIVRKWGAIITSITQHVETLLMSENGRRMMGDCQYVKLLNQHQNDRKHLGDLYGLSDEELSAVTDADIGCGLLIAGNAVIPFENKIPKDTQLYALLNTDPGKKTAKKEAAV